MNRTLIVLCLSILILSATAEEAVSQAEEAVTYTIGVGDRIRISVWQEPSLDREAEVGVDSMIVLPLVGPIRAGGYSPVQLSRILTERFSLYKRDISQVEVVVVEYNSREIFVIGEVASRGRYTFQKIPDLWTVIMTAGGPTQNAFLGEVRILRGSGDEEKSIVVNLNLYLLGGDSSALPSLQRGDTIYIPTATTRGVDAFATSVIYIYGEVAQPGLYLVGENQDLVGALLTAGGLNNEGDPTSVRVIREEGDRRTVNTVNINDFMERGEFHGNPVLKPGDTIEVSARKSSNVRRFMQELITPSFQTVTSVVALVVLIDRVGNNNN